VRRSVLALVLTAVVVLVAGSAAAALNARVLDASATSPVGGLASYLPATSPSGSPDAAASGGPAALGPTPNPTSSGVPDTAEDPTDSGTAPTGPGGATAAGQSGSATHGAGPAATARTNGNARSTHVSTSAPRTSPAATHRPRPSGSPEPGDDGGSSGSGRGSGSHSGPGGSTRPPSPSPSGSHTPDD